MKEPSEKQTLKKNFIQLQKRMDNLTQRFNRAQREAQNVDKGTQILLELKYQELAQRGTVLPFSKIGFRNFSQNEEDGILHYIFSLIGTTDKRTVEMCAGTGFECNSTNFILNHGWHGLLVDGDQKRVATGKKFFAKHADTCVIGPIFSQHWISRDSINDILTEEGFTDELDLFNLDIDGMDYWVWEAMTAISPRVVVAEVLPTLGAKKAITVPYAEDFTAQWLFLGENDDQPGSFQELPTGSFCENWAVYGGASISAFNKLAKQKGYRLIGANAFGSNAFFLRDDVGNEFFPEVSTESCLNNSYRKIYAKAWERIRDMEWQDV